MEEQRLMAKKVLMVIAQDNFRDEEYSYPREILEAEGARITVAAVTVKESRGMLGLKISPQIPLKTVRPTDYDAIVIVGGTGARDYLWNSTDLHRILQIAVAKDKIVGAICLASAVLAKAGLLKDKKATVFKTKESIFELENGGAHYDAQPLVVDGNIITANGPRAAKDFGRKIAEMLANQ